VYQCSILYARREISPGSHPKSVSEEEMYKKVLTLCSILVLFSMVLTACAPAAPQTVVQTVVVTQMVEVQGTPVVKEVIKEVTAVPAPAEKKLEIFDWWTGPGEKEAAAAMFKAMADKYPDVKIVENPVPGGGGVSQRVVLQARITAGLPPDTFQTLGGAELKNYVDSGVLEPLDDLYAQLKYKDAIPGPLYNAVTIGGHPYSVPLNMHLENILYYNKKLFDDNKITVPTDFASMIAACDAIKKAAPDMVCMALGSKEKWEDAFVLDTMILELGGPEYYVKLFKGEVDVTTDPIYKQALTNYQKLIPYINKDHANLTWDQSVGMVGAGKAGMVIMGTWAIGAFINGSKWQPGVDFGAVLYPAKPEIIPLFHPDTYGLAKGAPDPEVTKEWLGVVASPELQIPTDVTQGGLFARIDIDPTKFPDPIRQDLQKFVAANPGKLILDQHGSILPASAQTEYWNIVAGFTAQPDVAGTIKAVANMMTKFNVKDASAWYQWP
jgi:glucose/mannose transport system substrate-binding protein